MQFAARLLRIVHPADPEAQLESEVRMVAQGAGHERQMFAADEDGQLVPVHDDLLDRLRVARPGVAGPLVEDVLERVDEVVEVPP